MEKISLKAPDELTWTCMALMRAAVGRGDIYFGKSDGAVISGGLHAYWAQNRQRCHPVVKTPDLKSAYKQFAITVRDQPEPSESLRGHVEGSKRWAGERIHLPSAAVRSFGICRSV